MNLTPAEGTGSLRSKSLLAAQVILNVVWRNKMKNLIFMVCLVLLAGCSSAEPQRVEKAAFKGMELFSWKPAGKDWHFSLLIGTNRQKPDSMITAPETEIVGVGNLKQKLASLAKGEQVFW
jgi:hypothetical protein